jgi:hypothetical protein
MMEPLLGPRNQYLVNRRISERTRKATETMRESGFGCQRKPSTPIRSGFCQAFVDSLGCTSTLAIPLPVNKRVARFSSAHLTRTPDQVSLKSLGVEDENRVIDEIEPQQWVCPRLKANLHDRARGTNIVSNGKVLRVGKTQSQREQAGAQALRKQIPQPEFIGAMRTNYTPISTGDDFAELLLTLAEAERSRRT